MIRSSRGTALPRRILVLAVAGLIPVLAGCEAGSNAPVQHWHQPTPGAGTQFGGIAIRNVFILGAPQNGTLAAGRSAGLFLGLVNAGAPDKLLRISAPSAASRVTMAGGPISLPNHKVVLLTGPEPKVVLTGLTQPLGAGSFVNVTMTFQNAGSVTLKVPVMPRTQYYSTLSPAPAASATSTKRAGRHHRLAPTATPTPSPSGG